MRRVAPYRRAALTTALAALLAVTTASCGSSSGDCCAPAPSDLAKPSPHGPGTDIDYPSQSLDIHPSAGTVFSVFVRLDEELPADWTVSAYGAEDGVIRPKGVRTVQRTPDGETAEGLATRYFVFEAVKPGTVPLVLKDSRSRRTMTYEVEVGEDSPLWQPDEPQADASTDHPRSGAQATQDFQGTVTVERGEIFSVANHYSNVPGIHWRLIGDSDEKGVAFLSSRRPDTTGDPAGNRQDWYTFAAKNKGTITVKLFGCYRCEDRLTPKTAESKKFSQTKSITIKVE